VSQIDQIDERILDELQANGRLTMKSLAERIGLSSPAMIERVRRLEERGVISGYRAIVSPAAMGRPISALVTATVAHADHDRFMAAVADDRGVMGCQRITGRGTHLLTVHVADMAALEALTDLLSGAGAACETAIISSSPVAWRAITPPVSQPESRTRLARRRRRGDEKVADAPASEAPPVKRGPGRPRRNPPA
jgi:Lrp/AsnC family transcriptional regulator, leucine-responsive regulatory protein